MPVRLIRFALMMWLGFAANSAMAQREETSRMAIVEEVDGDRTLVVHYPWKVHDRCSIEVRLVTGKPTKAGKAPPDVEEARPLYFLANLMKGDVTINLYRCQDEAAGTPQRHVFTEREYGGSLDDEDEDEEFTEIEYEILGRRNRLGRPSVCVARRFSNDGPAPGATAIFCLLEPWAIDEGLLNLELPPKYFAKPGKLRVWLLRNDKVVWEQRADWPGIGE